MAFLELEDSLFSDNFVDDPLTRNWKVAASNEFWFAIGGVLHGDDNLASTDSEIHSTANTVNLFSWNVPVSEITSAADLESIHNNKIQLATSDHTKW